MANDDKEQLRVLAGIVMPPAKVSIAMTRTSAKQRTDPAVAREVIDSVFVGTPNGPKRRYQDFLRASVNYLSQQHSDRWAITLFGWGVRLNVGWVECLILRHNGLRILVHEDSAPAGTKFDRIRRKYASECRYTMTPLSEIPRALAAFTKSHHEALRRVAAGPGGRPPESIRNAHSVGITELLGLPNPAYSSTGPMAQRLIGDVDGTRPGRRYWTSYWREGSWAVNVEYKPVSFSGSNSFRKRGVSVGDVIYIVSQLSGQLLLGGRMTVGDIVSRDEAARIRKRNDLYDVDEWVVGERGSATALHQHRQLAPEVTKQLRFISGPSDPDKALTFANDRDLDRQTIRGVRQLTLGSAYLLDEIIEMTDEMPRSDGLITISEEDLRPYRSQRDLASALHEEAQDGVTYFEGSLKQILVNRYERDPAARDRCIRHHGCMCSVCGFDFLAAYGEVAAGFIHVHHLVLLSRIGPDYVVNPIEDLRPVCPNCHAIIHRCTPPYSIEDVRRFLDSRRSRER